jgi:hypothetical protein
VFVGILVVLEGLESIGRAHTHTRTTGNTFTRAAAIFESGRGVFGVNIR